MQLTGHFDVLFNRYYPVLCAYSESFVSDRWVAEDLVQDVFVQVWMKRDELDMYGPIGAYLYKSVHNACIQYLRHQQVHAKYKSRIQAKMTEAELIPVHWVSMDMDPAEENEMHSLYRETLEQLPDQTREIFLCSREKGLKYSEIANQAGISIKAVEYHISKALEIFRKKMKDYLWII